MALSIRPDLIDVNVHPTKKQVIFERQEELCEALQTLLEQRLSDIISNRTFEVDKITKKQQGHLTKAGAITNDGDNTYTHVREKDE